MFDQAGKDAARRQFRRLGWIMRILAMLGPSARLTPTQSAELVIELDWANGRLGPDLEALTCPATYIVGSGAHSGAAEEEMRIMRAATAEATASNARRSVFATTPSNHVQILAKDPETVAAAINEVVQQVR
ncbi:hypothetical protein ACIBHX_46020 [Nonomuraea sp. NPDC050536]|uniref:hypothetical protein n=1 Tax=Nonomuraea sp. NPDC050536 TaxID=3364366 RepID=UPI0037CAFE99